MTEGEKLGRRLRRQTVLVWFQAATAIAAIGLLVFTLVTIQSERRQSATTSCYLLREVVLVATPPARKTQALLFINSPGDPLHDCNAYGSQVTR